MTVKCQMPGPWLRGSLETVGGSRVSKEFKIQALPYLAACGWGCSADTIFPGLSSCPRRIPSRLKTYSSVKMCPECAQRRVVSKLLLTDHLPVIVTRTLEERSEIAVHIP